ncbi:MAG: MjaI family restriction endonuclease [Candidatus Cloacimonadaceae bacterium]|nr:MjaI family restriction endonuclease [Candidatus Cloacimonadaceae bacterium]
MVAKKQSPKKVSPKIKTEKIKFDSIKELLGLNDRSFPKYSRPLMVQANTFARSTDKKIVGHLSTLFISLKPKSLEEWIEKHTELFPDSIDTASRKLYNKLQDFKAVIDSLSLDDVEKWMKEFLYDKTYMGLSIQKAIFELFSSRYKLDFIEATVTDEGQNIDGWLGTLAVSIKPVSFKDAKHLPFKINDDIHVIFYEKMSNNIVIQYSRELEKACRSQVEN